jgi:hypothetical protein
MPRFRHSSAPNGWMHAPLLGWVWAVCLILGSLATQAAAQPSAQDRERARSLLDLGDAKFATRDYAAALQAYRAADAIMGVPTTGIEVGRALEKLGRLVEARDAFIGVTRHPKRSDEPKPFTLARQNAERLAAELGPRIPVLTLELAGLEDGAEAQIALDGEAIDSALLGVPIKVNPGAHRLTGSAPGYAPVEHSLTLAEGQSEQLELRFVAQPLVAEEPSPGMNDADGAEPVPELAPRRPWMWVGFGVAAAGAVAGGVTGILSLTQTHDIKDEQCNGGTRCAAAAQGDIDTATALANVSNVALAVGAVGLGIGVWQLFATRKRAHEERPASSALRFRAAPLISPSRVGVSGTF